MECKFYGFLHDEFRVRSELIDTLWNVNIDAILISICREWELIDTLWNVNGFVRQ